MASIAFALLYYLMAQSSLSANISRVDFWGVAMLLNIAGILAVITAFWVSVNLIDTLWTMLALTPVTLFIFNKGMGGTANCEIKN